MPALRPDTTTTGSALSRRATLLGLVGTTTTACSPYSFQTQRRRPARQQQSPTPSPTTDPDVALAATVLAAERVVLEAVDATIERHPRLRRVLTVTRAVHQAHVDLLADAVPAGAAATSVTPSPSPSAGSSSSPPAGSSGTPSADRPRVSRDPGRALRALAVQEDDLVLTNKRSAFAAESGAFARVLASMAAAASQQSAVLRSTRLGGARR